MVDITRFSEKPAEWNPDTDGLGGRTEVDVLQRQEESRNNNEAGIVGERLVDDMFWDGGGNAAISIIGSRVAELGLENDPDFNVHDHMDEFMSGLSSNYRETFTKRASSYAEGMMLREVIMDRQVAQEKAQAAGWQGTAATVASGILDVDAPLMLLSGGTFVGAKTANVLAKVGVQEGRLASSIAVGAAGAEAGLIVSAVDAVTSPEGHWSDVPIAGLSSMAFGTGIGALSKVDLRGNQIIKDTIDDFRARGAEDVPDVDPSGPKVYNGKTMQDILRENSAGASMAEGDLARDILKRSNREAMMAEASKSFYKESQAYLQKEGVFSKFDGDERTVTGRQALRFKEQIDKTPLKTDYERLSALGPSGMRAAYDLYESTWGIARNNGSAARYNETYHNQQMAKSAHSYAPSLKQYATDNGFSFVDHRIKNKASEAFHRDVIEYRAGVFFDGKGADNVHPAVKEYSEGLDATYNAAGVNMRGIEGEIPVAGFEDFTEVAGWSRNSWNGEKMYKMIEDDLAMRGRIENSIQASYRKIYPDVDPEDLRIYAKMVVTRKLSEARGSSTSIVGILQEDGRDFLAQTLVANGMSQKRADRFIDSLMGLGEEKGKLSFAKQRRDIDPRTPIEGTDLKIMDIMDTNIARNTEHYSRKAAGAAALARKGYQHADKEMIKQSIRDSAMAAGTKMDKEMDEFIDHLFTPFEGAPLRGGISPWVHRLKTATNLAVLNMMGFPQAGEMGAVIAASGVKNFMRVMPTELKATLGRPDSELTKQLNYMGVHQGADHIYNNPTYALEAVEKNARSNLEKLDTLDQGLNKLQHLQGFTSLFNHVKAFEQRAGVNAILYKMDEMFNKTGGMTEADTRRMYDMFGNDWKHIEKYFNDGTVIKDADGNMNLQPELWSGIDQGRLARGLNTFANQVVQKSMAGETFFWSGKDLGSLLTHLKSFPMLAMSKQAGRHARIGDEVAAKTFLYGLGTAAVAYYAKQVVVGKGDEKDFGDIAKGAFSYSNVTGWLPMYTDPLASMLGMDEFRFNHYGTRGYGGDIFSAPPVIPVTNKLLKIPQAAVSVATGNGTKQDVYNLKAMPILGNSIFLSGALNKMATELDKKRKAEKRLERAEKKAKKLEDLK